MATKTANVTARIQPNIKEQAEAILDRLGIPVSVFMHYISNDLMAPDAADNLLDKMKAEISKLSSFPKKHALIDEEPWRTEGVRKIVVKNFLIYYWVDDENNRVQVTAVIYSRRDQIRQLSNMDME